MAFNRKNLALIAHGNGQSVYLYKSADAILTVTGANYFNAAAEQMRLGDVIIAVDTNVKTVDLLMVSSADYAAAVTVVNGS